jgi:hypothetical protein
MSDKMKFYFCISCGSISRSFPQKILERLGGTAVLIIKGSPGRDMPSVGMLVGLMLASTRQAASALLELSSSTSSS